MDKRGGSAERATILPAPDEIELLASRPGSMTWRLAGNGAGLLTAGYTLVLQVAHPTVAAGVRDHSTFKSDPWGRLLRTTDFVYLMVCGTPQQQAATGAYVRNLHKQIKGPGYHALEPGAFSWVHASLGYVMVESHEKFCGALSAREKQQFWDEWRNLGRYLGIRERDLPENWNAALIYVDDIIQNTLVGTDAVQDVLELLAKPPRPDLVPSIFGPVWWATRIGAAPVPTLVTRGMLTPPLRRRLGVEWSLANQAELEVLAATARALPQPPNIGPQYLWLRRDALNRSYLSELQPQQQLA